MRTTILVKGMHCASCEQLLTDVLTETEGVKSVKVTPGNAMVEYDPLLVTEAQLRKAIEEEGYKTA